MKSVSWYKVVISIVFACAVGCITGVVYYQQQISAPLNVETNTLFEVGEGDSTTKVVNRLLDLDGVDVSPLIAKVWLKVSYSGDTIKRGIYEFEPDLSLPQIIDILVEGKQKQFSVTLVEGLTWKQWLAQLIDTDHLYNDWDDATEQHLLEKFSTDLGKPLQSLEGVLLADTYQFVANSSISQLVDRAFTAMLAQLDTRFTAQPLPDQLTSVYDVLILASIVEKETGIATERPLIAGVFTNRLRKNMRLQTDPTIIYGLGDEYQGDIKREHIKRPTPYNTYVIKGLPPTPIAMVGTAALDAVRDAETSDYLYFVAKGDGSHYFSQNLDEHNRAVRKYQLGKE